MKKKFTLSPVILFYVTISLFGIFKTTAQNTCATAVPITINGACRELELVDDTTQNTPNINNACGTVTFGQERWYTFTVSGGPLTVKIKADSVDRNLYLQLMSSTAACTGLTQIACANSDTANNSSQTETINQTLSNGIYYLKVVNVGGGSDMTIDTLCITAVINPCSSISNITACDTNINTVIPSGIGAYANLACGNTASGIEKIYTFTPAITGNYTIQQNSAYTNINYQFKPVSGGCSTSGWTCIANLLNTANSGTFTLTAGIPYYILVDPETTTGGTISFAVTCGTPIIYNDDCLNATTLSVNSFNSCLVTTAGNTAAATESLTGCSGTADDDVWYSFTALSPTQIITVTPSTLSNAVFEVFDGSCDGLVSLLCVNETSGSAVETAPVTGFIVGNTYYVRVYSEADASDQGSFTICISAPPNPCLSITEIDTCGTTINQIIPAGYGSYNNFACGDNAIGVEHIYVFTPTQNGDYYIVQNSAFGPVNYQIMLANNGCSEFGWNCIATLEGNTVSPYIDLNDGDEYYIMIDPLSATGGTVNFTLACRPPTPANDECTGAVSLTVNPSSVCTSSTNGTTIGSDESLPACSGSADDDVWYQFTATNPTHVITVTPNTLTDAVFEVFEGSCAGGLISWSCNDATTGNEVEGGVISGLTVGNTYYVRVYSNPLDIGFGTFNICVTTPPNPCDSLPPTVTCNTTISETVASGYGSYGVSGCGLTTNGVENIYSFTPDTTASYSIVQNNSYSAIDYQFKEAGLGCNELNWNCIGTLSDTATSAYFQLTAGIEYYILADPELTTGGDFNFMITCGVIPPDNDEPCNAIPLNVTLNCNYETFANTNASNSAYVGEPSCANYVNNDVWFSVVVPATGMVVIDTQSGDVTNSGVAIYEGDCNTMTELVCDDDSSSNPLMSTVSVSSRTPGEILYVRFWENGGGASGTFGICAISPPSCTEPNQASNFVLNTNTSSAISGSFTGSADGYLIIQSTVNIPPLHPVNNTVYNAVNISNLGFNYTFVANSNTPNFTAIDVTGNTHYYYYIYAYNNGTSCAGPVYSSLTPLTYDVYTCVTEPVSVSTNNITANSFTINWFAPIGGNALPITYTIEIATDSGFTTPISGSPFTVINPTISLNVNGLSINNTYYYRIKASTTMCNSAYVSGNVFTGYCASGSVSNTRYINNFTTTGGTTNISNIASGYSSAGYGAFLSQVVTQQIYGTINFSAAFFNGSLAYGFNIWVDWNDDLDFNDVGEKVYASGAYVIAASGSFTIPGNTSVGQHRMRIKADSGSLNPTACGTIAAGETEDYTLEVTPLPCSNNPTNLTAVFTSQTAATISWSAPTPSPNGGYEYYFSTSAVAPGYFATAIGSVGTGINSVSLSGLNPAATYYFWVRSYCDIANGAGVWVGPVTFSQSNCTTGNGMGTTALGCPSVVAGGLNLNGADPAPLNSCTALGCTDLQAQYLPIGDTTGYTVQSIPYAPPYQYGCLANPLSINTDDVWSPIVNLPFNFCFYGNNYNKCLVSSNGAITFDIINNIPSGGSAWSFNSNLPSPSLFKNAIFGVYQDIHPGVGGNIGWELITLNTGCRALVVSWKNVPMYSCTSIKYTGMMVLYENTNIIEVYIQEKTLCSSWNFGNAIVGIQNATGTQAVVAPGRNGLDTDWVTTNEAWRFVPSGNALTSIKWYEGSGTTGPLVGTTDVINVCPATTTTYTAEITYSLCNGTTLVETDQTTVTVESGKTWNGSVSNDWNNNDNWTPAGIPTGLDCVVVPVTPNNPLISGTNYNAYAGTLTVMNGASLLVNSSNNITVTQWINVQPSGTFQLDNTSNLIQINNDANTGNIIYKRNANIRRADYVYWSAPVANFNVNNIATPIVSGPVFKWNTTIPNSNGGQGNWISASAENMVPAKGYIVRGPSSFSATVPSTLYGTFTGTPNNGLISIPIFRGDDVNTIYHQGLNGTEITNYSDNWNLVGNPYPSAISGGTFLYNNRAAIAGNIKLWTHGTLPSAITSPFYGSFAYNYSPGDYLTYNYTGTNCCPTAGEDLYVGAAQGFFVQMNDGPSATDSVVFDNTLRHQNYSNNNFYRSSNTSSGGFANIERHRIWLDLLDANSNSDRMLVGYIEGATNRKDHFFDAVTQYTGSMALYSLIGNEKFNIQGRRLSFDNKDVIPLGVAIPTTGKYTIALGAVDGLFSNPSRAIYLEDKLTGKLHNLKNSPYSFSINQGQNNNRFALRFRNKIETVEEHDRNLTENTVAVYTDDKYLTVESSDELIANISVFDIVGRKLSEVNSVNQNTFVIEKTTLNQQTLIVKTTLNNGITVTQKIIL